MPTYSIKYSTEERIVGDPSQISDFSRVHNTGKHYFTRNDQGRFEPDIEWPVYRMNSKSKLVDLIRNVPLGYGLMISDQCLEVFSNFKLPEYQTFPLRFVHKGKMVTNYFAFTIVNNPGFQNFINWEESKFYKTQNYHKEILEEVTLSSLAEIKSYRASIELIGFGLLPEIKLDYHNDFDLIAFYQDPLPVGYFCSEYARDAIIKASLTGFRFVEVPESTFTD